MNRRIIAVATVLTVAISLSLATVASTAQNQPPPPADNGDQQGMEVLTRGPIHEAYAEPVTGQPAATPVIPKQPPDPIEEEPSDQKPADANVVWIPGYWAWDGDRNDFLWVSGIWRDPPPGRTWVPGHWDQVQNSYQWVPGFWQEQEQEQVNYLPPPPAPLDAAASTPAPNQDSVYVPGTWIYRSWRYVWRPGYWVDYRPGWVWVPAHYVWSPAGYVFIDGYWDYGLDRRGLIFAPVYFTRPLWTVRSWFYRPLYVVHQDFLFGALFVRPGVYSYYFGDYFDRDYRQRGYVSWYSYRYGRVGYDPLFSYYRWAHRDDQAWLPDMRALYRGRYRGELVRPPHTLVQQNTLIQNITVNKNVNVTNINKVTNINNISVVAPITQINNTRINNTQINRTQVKLVNVTKQEKQVYIQHAAQLRQVSQERRKQEGQLVTRGAAPTTGSAQRQTVRLSLAKAPAQVQTVKKSEPPAPPIAPVRRPRSTTATGQTNPPRGDVISRPVVPRQETTPRTPGQPQPKPMPKVEKKETKPAPQPQPKPPSKTEKKEAKPAPQPQPKPPPKEEKKESKPASNPPPKPAPKEEKKESKPALQPHPQQAPRAEKKESKPAPQPAPKVEKKEATPTPPQHPQPNPPQPAPKAESKPAPAPQPKPAPKPPEKKPEPKK
jgi:hypothetical protein